MSSTQDHVNRLREEFARRFSTHHKDLEQRIRNLQEQLSTSLREFDQMLAPPQEAELTTEVEALLSGVTQEAQRQKDRELSLLAHFARDLRGKETQEEILNLLLDGGCSFAPRLALFVARGTRFAGWSTRGYPGETALRLGNCSFEKSDSPLLGGSLHAEGLKTARDLSGEPALSDLIESEAAGPWHAFPLKALGRPVAVLMAESTEDRPCRLEALFTILELTGLCIENLALKVLNEKAREAARAEPEKYPAEAAPAPSEAPEGEAEAGESAPEPAAAAQPEDEVAFETPPAVGEVQEAAEETVAAGEPAGEESPPARQASRLTFPMPAQTLSEEEKLHSDAKRFARLLVSEIKLYNEQRVAEGRERRDLYLRLKRDIDRSRDMYDQRVPPAVRNRIDYFHEEIVRILGDNDPAALGGEYPGPVVES